MIKSLIDFLKCEFSPRWMSVLLGPEILLAILIAVVAWLGLFSGLEKISASELLQIVVTYASIAMGFSIAGLSLVISKPDQELAKRLSSHRVDGKKTDSYSDLLFIFAWCAFVHWIVLMASVVWIVLGDSSAPVMFGSGPKRIVTAAMVGAICYALFEFLNTVISLSQFGRVYIELLRSK